MGVKADRVGKGYSDLESASPESASGSGPQSPAPFLRAHALSPAETNSTASCSHAAPAHSVPGEARMQRVSQLLSGVPPAQSTPSPLLARAAKAPSTRCDHIAH